jgi:HlyD family secretion protein
MRWFALGFVAVSLGAGAFRVLPDLLERSKAASVSAFNGPGTARTGARRIFAGGTVEGMQREIPLHFEISGRISRVRVKEGDVVEQGQILAELDAETWDLRLSEALARLKLVRAERDRLVNGASQEARAVLKSEVQAAEVQVREGESLLARGKALLQRNAIAAQEVDEYRYKYEKAAAHLQTVRARLEELEAPVRTDDLNVADARVALAEAAVRQGQNAVEKTRLRAPSKGVVLHVLAEPGRLAGPEDGRDLLTVANRDSTRVRAYVEELDALNVKVGQRAVVTTDGKPDREYAGMVQSCSPHVRPKEHKHLKPGEMTDIRSREIVIDLENGDDLVIGLPVDVFIEADVEAH